MDKKDIVKFFGSHHEAEVTAMLDANSEICESLKLKNPKVTLVLAIFLGLFAIDRLYQAGIKMCLYKLALMLLTIGTWWFVDIGYSIKLTQEVNYNNLLAASTPTP